MSTAPWVVLNNGHKCPIIGLGTWQELPQSKSADITEAVKHGIDVGYRLVDCAHVYGNEPQIGVGLTTKLEEGTVKREDLFITSKLWCTYHRPDLVEGAIRTTLKNLGLEYLDLYLIHWPQAFKINPSKTQTIIIGGSRLIARTSNMQLPHIVFEGVVIPYSTKVKNLGVIFDQSLSWNSQISEEGDDFFPEDDAGKMIPSAVDYIETWTAMEALVDKGLTRSIGLSNFNKRQIERVMEVARIKPAVLQIECHPYLNQAKLLKFCVFLDVVVIAGSPLGSPDRPWAKPSDPLLLEEPNLKSIAGRYSKTVAQVLIRYAIDRGLIVIPKSVTKSRIEQNFAVFDFKLSPEDIDLIASLECNGRLCTMGDVHHPDYPFHDEY